MNLTHARQTAISIAEPATRRWTVTEYHRAADAGVFGPEERLELIDGEIYCMSPQKPPHAASSDLTEEVIRGVFPSGYRVRVQKPLSLDAASEPEPDVAVVAGSAREFAQGHPTAAVLVIEVADTSLAFDRDVKGAMYARAGVLEYWILNLPERVLEVFRDPRTDLGRYEETTRHGAGDAVAPLAAPATRIAVSDLLP